MTVRVLGARRLSRVKDNSTSFERQELAITTVAGEIGGRVVGWADDPDVSAEKVAPADRPGLGPWLLRPNEYDAIAWWRQDRAVRSMQDMAWLAAWARKHKKRLIFAEGPGGGRLELDMASPISELILMIFAFAAQMEVQAIKERTEGSTQYLRSVGRWGGGRVPFGRKPVPHPEENEGYWLGRHDETAEIVEDMIGLALAGQSYHAIAAWLNTTHPGKTPANHRRELKAQKMRALDPDSEPAIVDTKAKWNPGMVSAFLRQQSLRGYKVVGNEVVRDEVGEPILCGDPLISDDDWRRLQALMDAREQTPSANRSNLHPLLGVLHGGTCGGRLYQGWLAPGPNRKVAIRQYRCAAKAHGKACGHPEYVVAEPVDRYVEEEFLKRFGSFEVIEQVEFPGVDHTAEIEELKATVADLSARIATLRGPAADALMGQLQGRSDRLERLQAQPVIPARVEQVSTGKSYAEVWEASNQQERLKMLLAAGVKVYVGQTTRGARDVTKRLSFTVGQHDDPMAAAQEAIDAEESYYQ